ncbi:hypothetical protein [Deinococcus navajonensis]|uniref:Uncharacterized protein n=1 Tax=Deinococcus navajonensis TaxID=309884 RepID=A0ABV8XRC9_9DEIO
MADGNRKYRIDPKTKHVSEVGKEKKDPLERIADALERIADHLAPAINPEIAAGVKAVDAARERFLAERAEAGSMGTANTSEDFRGRQQEALERLKGQSTTD